MALLSENKNWAMSWDYCIFVLRKLILQTRMRSHPVGLYARCFGQTFRLLIYFMCANSEGSGETARMRRLTWTFSVRLCDKYHNLMSWLNWCLQVTYIPPQRQDPLQYCFHRCVSVGADEEQIKFWWLFPYFRVFFVGTPFLRKTLFLKVLLAR